MTPPDRDSAGRSMGQIVFDGRPVADRESARNALRRQAVGFVFQRFNLIPVLSAADNVAVSLRVRGMKANGQTEPLFEALGIEHLRRRKPGEMSIGEQQRVAVARAMAHRPALLLADEPTGNLDSDNASELLGIFRRMNEQFGQTVVMITHSAEAAGGADRVVRMKDGRVES